jgi:cyclic beta-1,2-glucan synthetase
MYRVGLVAILGFRKRGETLFIEPAVPSSWREYTIEYRHGKSRYTIVVSNEGETGRGPFEVTVDGQTSSGGGIPLVDDGEHHAVQLRLGVTSAAGSVS